MCGAGISVILCVCVYVPGLETNNTPEQHLEQ